MIFVGNSTNSARVFTKIGQKIGNSIFIIISSSLATTMHESLVIRTVYLDAREYRRQWESIKNLRHYEIQSKGSRLFAYKLFRLFYVNDEFWWSKREREREIGSKQTQFRFQFEFWNVWFPRVLSLDLLNLLRVHFFASSSACCALCYVGRFIRRNFFESKINTWHNNNG